MVGIDDSRRPPSQQHSRHMSDPRDRETRGSNRYPPSAARGRELFHERPQRSTSGSRQSRRSRSQGRQAMSNMAMDPLYDSDSHEEKPARVSRPRRWAELVNRKLSGNQSRNDERQVTNSPTSYSERMQVMGSPPSVLPKRKPLEPETSKPLPNPHANSPRSVEEATQEEEYDTGVENAGDPNENERTDSKFDGEPTDDNLEEKLQKSQAELREAKQQIEQLNSDITDLREILTNKSSKSFQAPMQLPLHCPESDIINSWHALDYGVRNLVVNHFKGSKESKMLAWTRRQEDYLRDLTPHYTEVATDSKCATAFIEAAIWYALCTSTFGPDAPNAPFFWAGKYKRNMATMSKYLAVNVLAPH